MPEATTVNIPDTVGYATPQQMFDVIHALRNRVPNIDKAILSVHCHDDLGLAVCKQFGSSSGWKLVRSSAQLMELVNELGTAPLKK